MDGVKATYTPICHQQPLQEFKRALTSEQEKMSRWTNIIEQQYRAQEGMELVVKVDFMFARIEGLAQQVSNIATRTLTEEEQRIFAWLSKYSFSDSQNPAAQRREPGTGAWILSLPEYKLWKTQIAVCCGCMESVSTPNAKLSLLKG